MPLDTFFAGRFDEHREALQAEVALWLFVHVPKTAGSSLGGELARLAPPYFNIHIDHLDRSKPGPDRFDDAVEVFLQKNAGTPYRSASGHIQNRHMERICEALPGVLPITMLRNPIARLISDYRYQRSPMHPLSAQVMERIPDFAAFLQVPGQKNRMAKHLVPIRMVRKNDLQGAVAYVMQRFAFVGLQERYDLHFAALTKLVSGQARHASERRRVNEAGEKVVVTPELEAMARAQNAVDFAIYEAIEARFAKIDASLEAWVKGESAAAQVASSAHLAAGAA